MAKKKKTKKSNNNQAPKSPQKYIRTIARKLPIAKCYMTENIFETGLGNIIITRQMYNGNFVVGLYLVDIYCLGVKDCGYNVDIDPWELKEYINKGDNMKEVEYPVVHNLILGAIEFAEEAGVPPHADFAVGQFILEEDSDAIPLIKYEYGYNGKHHLFVATRSEDTRWIPVLKKRLGDDFTYVCPDDYYDDDEWDDGDEWDDDDEDDSEDYWDGPTIDPETGLPEGVAPETFSHQVELLKKVLFTDSADKEKVLSSLTDEETQELNDMLMRMRKNFKRKKKEENRNPQIQWAYEYPEYPQELKIKHQIIADTFFTDDERLSEQQIDTILQLPHNEVADDIVQIVFYKIGQTYRQVEKDEKNDEYYDASLMHSMIFLAELGEPQGLDAILELCRQTEDYINYFFSIFGGEYINRAVESCGKERIPDLIDFILSPDIPSLSKMFVLEGLLHIATHGEDKREEVIEAYRTLLEESYKRLPETDCVDAFLAAWIISYAARLGEPSLKPLAERIDSTNIVDRNVYGSFQNYQEDDFAVFDEESLIEPIADVYASFED